MTLPIDVSDPSVVDRFWSKVVQAGDCWDWTAGRDPKDYGQFWVAGRMVRAHRFAYELIVGPIPDGLELDHLCRNHECVRPEHLDAVPHKVNVLRGISPLAVNALKTTCLRGHLLSGDNLYVNPDGERTCRACKNARDRACRAAKRLSELAVAV